MTHRIINKESEQVESAYDAESRQTLQYWPASSSQPRDTLVLEVVLANGTCRKIRHDDELRQKIKPRENLQVFISGNLVQETPQPDFCKPNSSCQLAHTRL